MQTLNELINLKFENLDKIIKEIQDAIAKDSYSYAWSMVENSNRVLYEIKSLIDMLKIPSQLKVKQERFDSKKSKLSEIIKVFKRSDYFNDI